MPADKAIIWTPTKNGGLRGHTRGHPHRKHEIVRNGRKGFTLRGSDFGHTPISTLDEAKARAEKHELSKFPELRGAPKKTTRVGASPNASGATRIAGVPVHPAAQLFPMLPETQLLELAEDIKGNGLKHPIVRHEGKVLDGRNRLEACKLAGVEPRFEEWNGKGSATAYAISANVKRRHLTPSQLAMVAADALHLFEAEAKVRQREGARRGGKAKLAKPGADRRQASEPKPTGKKERAPKASAIAASAVGAAGRTVERAKAVKAKAPELAEKVRQGEITLNQAERQAQGDDINVRFTPRELITTLHAEHRFTIDVASHPASPAAQVIGRHWTREDDGLEEAWAGERVFCNPPFDDIPAWVAKAHHQVREGCPLVVMLLPATRTEQPFWQEYIEPFRDRPAQDGVEVTTRFLEGRTRFGFPGDPEGERSGSPPFGCVLVIWRAAEKRVNDEPKPTVHELHGGCPAEHPARAGLICHLIKGHGGHHRGAGDLEWPEDDGTLCGIIDGKGAPCFHKQGHDGPHSNGRRTWANKARAVKPELPKCRKCGADTLGDLCYRCAQAEARERKKAERAHIKDQLDKAERAAAAAELERCKVCGCTWDNACPGGCAWVDAAHTLCTACVELEPGDKPVPKKPPPSKEEKPPLPPGYGQPGEHDFEKVNLVTRPDGTDLYRCTRCPTEYVRHGTRWSPPGGPCPPPAKKRGRMQIKEL